MAFHHYTLVDGVRLNAEHPTTFEIPSEAEKDALAEGDLCKVGIEFKPIGRIAGERFWVRITDRDGDNFLGDVLDALLETRIHGLDYGDEIAFGRQHVIGTYDKQSEVSA